MSRFRTIKDEWCPTIKIRGARTQGEKLLSLQAKASSVSSKAVEIASRFDEAYQHLLAKDISLAKYTVMLSDAEKRIELLKDDLEELTSLSSALRTQVSHEATTVTTQKKKVNK